VPQDQGVPDPVAALVVPRSRSGRSFRNLQKGPVPADLSPYQPLPETLRQVRSAFEKLGFKVYEEALGITLTIEGPAELFASVFAKRTTDFAPGVFQVQLDPPPELKDLLESISLI